MGGNREGGDVRSLRRPPACLNAAVYGGPGWFGRLLPMCYSPLTCIM